MIPRLALIVFAFTGVLLTGCASITGSTNQTMSVQTRQQGGSEVSGAACELSNNKGKWFVTTPGSVMIHKSNDDMQVLCEKSGMQPGRAAVVSETKGSMFGNILLGGGIGAIVDHNNGSAYEYPNLIQILMGTTTKIEKSKNTDATAGNSAPVNTTAPAPIATSAPANQMTLAATTNDDKLKELKRLSDEGLISKEVYLERQRVVLEGR